MAGCGVGWRLKAVVWLDRAPATRSAMILICSAFRGAGADSMAGAAGRLEPGWSGKLACLLPLLWAVALTPPGEHHSITRRLTMGQVRAPRGEGVGPAIWASWRAKTDAALAVELELAPWTDDSFLPARAPARSCRRPPQHCWGRSAPFGDAEIALGTSLLGSHSHARGPYGPPILQLQSSASVSRPARDLGSLTGYSPLHSAAGGDLLGNRLMVG